MRIAASNIVRGQWIDHPVYGRGRIASVQKTRASVILDIEPLFSRRARIVVRSNDEFEQCNAPS